jgi:hypothetical protein
MDAPDIAHVATSQALKYRAVFAVHGKDCNTAFAGAPRYNSAGHYKGLLVGKRHTVPRINRAQKGLQAGRADERADDNINFFRGKRLHTFGADPQFDREPHSTETFCCRWVRHRNKSRMELEHLIPQQVHIAACDKARHLELVRKTAHHVKDVAPDGAG